MSASTFQQAVEQTPCIKDKWRDGLQAIKGEYRSVIDLKKPQLRGGSLDIDAAIQPAEPDAERWDYAVQHDGLMVFVEVHPADGDHHVTKMVGKVKWLKQWLRDQAPLIGALPRATEPFRWVHTGRNTLRLPPGSHYARLLNQNSLSKPVKPLAL